MHIAHAQSHNKVSKTTQATSENTIILFVCPPQILHKHCYQFLLRLTILDFEDTFCGKADFERSVDHGFLQYLSVDYGFCLF